MISWCLPSKFCISRRQTLTESFVTSSIQMRAASYSLPVLRCSDVTRTIGASGNLPWKKEKYDKEAIRAIKIAFYCKWRRVNASLKYCCTWNSLLVAYPHFIWNLSMFPFLFLSSVFFGLTGPEKPTFWPVSTHMAANFARFILNSKIQLDLLSYFCLFD